MCDNIIGMSWICVIQKVSEVVMCSVLSYYWYVVAMCDTESIRGGYVFGYVCEYCFQHSTMQSPPREFRRATYHTLVISQ